MRIRLRDRLRYRLVDQALIRPVRLMAVLAGAAALVIAFDTLMAIWFTPNDLKGATWLGKMWHSLTLALDPGTIGDETGTKPFRLIMLVTTVGGILIISTLIGVLSATFNGWLENQRRGRTKIAVGQMAVVLGWSDQIHTILDELALAKDRQDTTRGRRVVILSADLTKQEMEDQLRFRTPRGIKVTCRYGDPTRQEDLELVPLDAAYAVIVPRPVGKEPDVRVLMTLLVLNNREWARPIRPPLAAVISSKNNKTVAERALDGWSDGAPARQHHVVDAEDLISRILVQSRRYPGLSATCGELLSFAGNEIREVDDAGWHADAGRPATYGEAQQRFRNATLIGFNVPGEPRPRINPRSDAPVEPSHRPLVIAQGSHRGEVLWVRPGKQPAIHDDAINMGGRDPDKQVEHTLILGRNSRIDKIVEVLRDYVAPGSQLDLVGIGYERVVVSMGNLTCSSYPADPTDDGVLRVAENGPVVVADGLSLELSRYKYVIVVADDESEQYADARALATLLHLREVRKDFGASFRVICELSDDANLRLAHSLKADDLVVGSKVVSSTVVQYAMNPTGAALTEIVDELLNARDNDLYVEPAEQYVDPGVSVTFATIVKAAAQRAETAIGYRLSPDDAVEPGGVRLNPDKAESRVYRRGDRVIVIANRYTGDATPPAAARSVAVGG